MAIWAKRAGAAWKNLGLVFCTRTGGPLEAGNVRRAFRAVTRRAGIGEGWTPRELRHSFVSIMSDARMRLKWSSPSLWRELPGWWLPGRAGTRKEGSGKVPKPSPTCCFTGWAILGSNQ
ncbi:tyrosine-type recombinase/integrase [Actinocorallia sp. A-T 12471]|uniref:tyrosine-type recombinase/integrase n=1 Tax=Actinocorallia sp. A-T 12471 TaxID=3089813 RepID=UPI0039B6FC4C